MDDIELLNSDWVWKVWYVQGTNPIEKIDAKDINHIFIVLQLLYRKMDDQRFHFVMSINQSVVSPVLLLIVLLLVVLRI